MYGQDFLEHAAEQTAAHLADLGSIALVASLAVLLGLVFIRLRQPPIVGYILAGIVLGPTGFGFIEHSGSISLLAEIGLLLLLFLIGMELSVRAFVRVLAPAIIIAGGQLLAGLSVSALFGMLLGWSLPQILVLGFIIALSSTAVAIKILEDIGELRTETGRITIGVLIAQDIAIVPMLIITDSFGGEGGFGLDTVALIIGSIAVLGALIWYLNQPGKLRLPFTRHIDGKPDMIALTMLAFCFSAATISSLLGLSPVFGAFLAGLIIANSTLRTTAIQITYPVQSIFVFVFFLSVGLLIDLDYIAANWATVVMFVLFVVVAKSLINILLVRRVGMDWAIALPAGLAMAQIGEFSFILAAAGLSGRVLDQDAYRLALSVIAMTLIVSPLWMVTARRFHDATTEGLSTLREALAIAYAGELGEFEKGRSAVMNGVQRARIYRRAVRMAGKQRKLRREEAAALAASAAPDTAPTAAADAVAENDAGASKGTDGGPDEEGRETGPGTAGSRQQPDQG